MPQSYHDMDEMPQSYHDMDVTSRAYHGMWLWVKSSYKYCNFSDLRIYQRPENRKQRSIMESLIREIQQEAASATYVGRKKLLDTLRDLQYSIEAPEDTMQRVMHLVRFPN